MFRPLVLRPALLVTLLLATLPAIAQSAAPTFTIATSNTTVSTIGTGSIAYTLTSVNGYIGTVKVTCQAPNVAAGISIPYCVPPAATQTDPYPTTFNLTANQIITGSFALNSTGDAATSSFLASRNPVLAIFFVVALLSGLTLRRHSARRLTLPLFLAVLAALSCTLGCGKVSQGFTPGTYTYVIGATQSPVPLYIGANAAVAIH